MRAPNKARTIATAIALGIVLHAAPAGAAGDLVSGLAAGTPTVSIPVRDVTGPYRGDLICYVCEFQDAPNVLAFFRGADETTAELIKQLDALYKRHAEEGFEAVAMIVAGAEAAPWLEALAQSADIEIPLTVFRRGPQDVAAKLYELNPQVHNTFLVTRNRFVVANVADIDSAGFERVERAAAAMLAQGAP